MTPPKRLIEVAFPLKQASLDSVHEKNVRHGHISTLHIWPARRPLAACRAALIATLLPDPDNDTERKEILERLAGKVVEHSKKKKQADGKMGEELKEETEGGILHWGRESGPDLEWFRKKILAAYGGRAPRVLDPFAGGGAIPLEAMRLGCEATAVDINPVAWFILKCTLEYPQKLAGQTLPLPEFVLEDKDFMQAFLKSRGFKGANLQAQLDKIGPQTATTKAVELPFKEFSIKETPGHYNTGLDLTADLAWHVRAWGRWVLAQSRRDLARFYPTYADFEPLVEVAHTVERRPLTLVPLKVDGTADIDVLNAEFTSAYLVDKSNPRWVAKPTVAYLWARTVICKNCGTLIPLLKTRWLAKKEKKRILLTMIPLPPLERAGQVSVQFGIQTDVPIDGHTPAERVAHDKHVGIGTMSRSGAHCPVCNQTTMTTEDIRLEGQARRLGAILTAVALDGQQGKEYRLPTKHEIEMAGAAEKELDTVFTQIPFGLPDEPTPAGGGSGAGRAFSVQGYGMMKWSDLFINRQLLSLGVLIKRTHAARSELKQFSLDSIWQEAIGAYLGTIFSRTVDYMAFLCVWEKGAEEVKHVFMRWALPITWDFAEANPLSSVERYYAGGLNSAQQVISRLFETSWERTCPPTILNQSAINEIDNSVDLIFTDPPYYDAIPYSDLMDFFYIWLRRSLFGLSPQIDSILQQRLAPKWNHSKNDGELIDDESRHNGSSEVSKKIYEDGMYRAFLAGHNKLAQDGRLIVVFANKNPFAWETLVASIIRAGFCVTGSWPIASEMPGGLRNLNRASLASSIWLVCRKRLESARSGWDNRVLEEMRTNIGTRLRQFWDAGIRGPDFVWAATGPALEAYSQYPVVKKANQPGEVLEVGEFLTQVRRMVVDFVVGRVLTLASGKTAFDGAVDVDVSSLDLVTTYYMLHRNDFGLNDAPAGPCILYAVSCGLSDGDLADRYDLLARRGGKVAEEDDETEAEEDQSENEGTGSVFRLKAWNQRKRPNMGFEPGEEHTLAHLPLFPEMPAISESEGGYVIPLIDQVHRLMLLWRAGDVANVDDYLGRRALHRNQLFHQLLQALIELAPTGSEERSLLESISNHVSGNGKAAQRLL